MQLQSRSDADKMVVEVLEKRLDAAIAVQFKDAVREISHNGPPRIILDLARVEFLDSSGLGSVIGAMKVLAPERKLELACLTESVHKVFRLTRMDSVILIHESVPEIGTSWPNSVHAC